jgi:hypothetical protein
MGPRKEENWEENETLNTLVVSSLTKKSNKSLFKNPDLQKLNKYCNTSSCLGKCKLKIKFWEEDQSVCIGTQK